MRNQVPDLLLAVPAYHLISPFTCHYDHCSLSIVRCFPAKLGLLHFTMRVKQFNSRRPRKAEVLIV